MHSGNGNDCTGCIMGRKGTWRPGEVPMKAHETATHFVSWEIPK
jgi:hypothetical protein